MSEQASASLDSARAQADSDPAPPQICCAGWSSLSEPFPQIVEEFVSEGVGGIVLAPIDDTALRRPVAAAMQKGIPVVIMDSALKGEPGNDFISTVSTNTTALEKWLASS